MKRACTLVLTFLVFVFCFDTTACAKTLSISAQAYVLYCVENDSVILEHNAETKMKMASTTKIMTTLLALEKAQENDCLVEFNEDMIAEGSSMYLKVGDTVHLSDLAVGMMMCSGNDAANAVALTLSDSIEGFAKLMNKKAKKLRMENTNFVTPSGLDDENHYSTALDMARLMEKALLNEQFAKITSSTSLSVDFLSPQKSVTYQNHNRLLNMYEYCIGGKTGFTKAAGRCLVSASKKDGVTLICVTFNAPSDWNDHIAMYNYGFEKLSAVDTDDSEENFYVDVVGSDKSKIPLFCENGPPVVVEKDKLKKVKREVYIPKFLYAPISYNDFVGAVTYTLDGEIIAQNSLYAMEDVDAKRKNKFALFLSNIF
ncbi:MAG: D-alanyl-D-alanine carboxypeptidase [Ruminococcus sp.]|nr:D-alanyl-D-alanine carboxypeptidase [Ruminococcus sp.]